MAEANPYSNPLAPSDDEEEKGKTQNKLSNSDFRNILMTPRVVGSTSNRETSSVFAKPQPVTKKNRLPDSNRVKKKKAFKQLKTEEEERNKELNEKYRDRAKERRQEDKKPKENKQPNVNTQTTSNYTAVPPAADQVLSLAEKRKEEIEKSQYLGGTLETTHNVKGLDKRFLYRIREEIRAKELEEALKEQSQEKAENEKKQIPFKTALAERIMAALPKDTPIVRNELFIPGRMTFVFELDDPYQVIPTAIIKSKADCGRSEAPVTLTNNDIVINKLIENFYKLRTGRGRDKKKKTKDAESSNKNAVPTKTNVDENIFDVTETNISSYDRPLIAERGARNSERTSYFEKPLEEDDYEEKPDFKKPIKELVHNIVEKFSNDTHDKESAVMRDCVKKFERQTEIDCYAECYPGMMEDTWDLDDSDDEVDYTKMDQGSRRAPIGRWDFENPEQYEDFMARKEALPKAAFQYNVKVGDGRSTRRTGAKGSSKDELNKEWSKIQNMMADNKRKAADPAFYEGMRKKLKT